MILNNLAFLSSLLLLVRAAPQAGPIVDLGYAKYQGTNNATTGLSTFFGIRYAAPPTGNLRWRAPQPPTPQTQIQDATVMGPQCFQAGSGSSSTSPFLNTTSSKISKRAIATEEDCLLLNVYSPPLAQTKKLPVVVWIHGGGYMAGNADSTGEDLVHNSQDQIVAVLIQYRLGILGFLPGSEVKNNGDLNAGLLDQQFALQWVQNHISKFGGDPNEVTIWGESAGAGSVLQHIIANGGNTQPPLFKRAMTSSTFLPFQYKFSDPIPEQIFKEAAQQANCTTNAMTCLRSVPASQLQTINTNIASTEFFGEFIFVPVVDGTLIRDSPVATISRGVLNGQTLLSITNTFEGRVFVNSALSGTLEQYIANAAPTLSSTEVTAAAKLYSTVPGLTTVLSQAIAVQGELIFICPTYYLLDAFGERSHKGEFAIPGGDHGEDVGFYFNSGSKAFNNAAFIASFSQAFSDITVSGDVNNHVSSDNITPNWPAWNSQHTEMLFNRTADSTAPVIHTIQTDPLLLQRCNFWKSLAPKTGQ